MIKAFNYFHRSTLFHLKPIRYIKNLSKDNYEGSSHLWFILLHVFGIALSNIKSSLLPFSSDVYQMSKVFYVYSFLK